MERAPGGLRDQILACNRCDLRANCRSPVPWGGPDRADILFFGEKPGNREDHTLTPFSGPAGAEFDGYLFHAYLDREAVRVSNVTRCLPPNNKSPSDAQIAACFGWTLAEIMECDPKLIVAMGAVAARALIGPGVRIDDARGKVFPGPLGKPVFVATHPAAGLHNGREIKNIREDFARLHEYLTGTWMANKVTDQFAGQEDYREITNREQLDELMEEIRAAGRVSSDTEWTPDGKIWCASFCVEPPHARVVYPDLIPHMAEVLGRVEITLHSAQADLNPLRSAGIPVDPFRLGDTMIGAYILNWPQGLKTLAKTECGMDMEDYGEVVGPYQKQLEIEFFQAILDQVPPVQKEKGDRRQTLHAKVKRAFNDYEKDPECDWRGRWKSWDSEQKRPAIELLGDFPTASLADVPREKAVWYAARDADSTERVRRVEEARMREWKSFRI